MVFEVNGPVILVTLERQLLELSVGMSALGASGVLVSGIPTWGRRRVAAGALGLKLH